MFSVEWSYMPRNAFSQTGLHPNWLMPSSLAACGFAICTHCLPLTHPAPVTLKKITDCSQSMISLNMNKLVTYLLFKMIIPKTKLATKEPYKKNKQRSNFMLSCNEKHSNKSCSAGFIFTISSAVRQRKWKEYNLTFYWVKHRNSSCKCFGIWIA